MLIDISPIGNANQRVMAFVHVRLGKIDIIGRHKREVHFIGHFDKAAFCQSLGLWQTAVAGMTL